MPATGRVIGIDLGSRRIGVALSDSARVVATALTVVHRGGDVARDHRALADLVAEHGASGIVVGLPRSLSGGLGPAGRNVMAEVEQLREALGMPVTTHDERFTTVTAVGALRASGRPGRRQREVVDQVAAAVMLQSWLDSRRGTPGE